ncbi:MAG TPA: methyltransferase domain-containing protein [Pseudonocardia sp.]|nr:methyltransferase domain-containing protein [Pseudonocardia sp.]
MTNTETRIDADAVEAFAGRVLSDFAGAAGTAMTIIGDRLGLYDALTGAGPLEAGELARRTRLHPRLVTEWLAAQTVCGYVLHDPLLDTYELPVEHAMALSVVASPAYVIGAAEVIAGQYATLGDLQSAFRGNGGIDYGCFPDTVMHGIERFFSTAYTHQLAQTWFPAVDGLVERLDDGARVADVGCGHGAATLLMARTWPRSTFTGFDLDEPSITVARARAADAGAPANIGFRVADAAGIAPGPFDVVVFFDALHDLGDPVAALRRAHELLTPGGILVAVEPWSTDRLEDGIDNPIARIDYAVSTSMCTPTSLAQPGGYGLGTCGGPARRLRLLSEAGFVESRLAADTGHNLVLTARAGAPAYVGVGGSAGITGPAACSRRPPPATG